MEKILVPIDSIERDNTMRGVENAIEIALGCDSEEPELILLHVFHIHTGIPEDLREKEREMERKRIKAEFDFVKGVCKKGKVGNVKTILRERDPSKKKGIDVHIIEVALENEVDLIVMGSGRLHERDIGGKIKKFVYGSVTERVLHETPCSVLVSRPRMSLERILVPVDSIEWDNTMRGVKNAIEFASGCRDREPEIIFLHVLHPSSGIDMSEQRLKLEKGRIKAEFDTINELCDEKGVSNVKTIVRDGGPAKEKTVDEKIVETARENNVDIIVMGSGKLHKSSTTSKIKKFVYGSVTERVLHEAPCSVMVVPPVYNNS